LSQVEHTDEAPNITPQLPANVKCDVSKLSDETLRNLIAAMSRTLKLKTIWKKIMIGFLRAYKKSH